MCCKLLRVQKPQTNQCCHWKCTKTQSGLPAYSLLCWQNHMVYKFVKLYLERSTEKKPDYAVTELSNVNNIEQSALQSITCSHMHTSISPLSCLKLRLCGLLSQTSPKPNQICMLHGRRWSNMSTAVTQSFVCRNLLYKSCHREFLNHWDLNLTEIMLGISEWYLWH